MRWIGSLFRLSSEHPTGGHILFWVALVAALGCLGFWLVRLGGRQFYGLNFPGAPPPVAVRSWQQWLHAARAASNVGDVRKAIECAYWAGVSRLEESGALPTGATHTAREYLRLLSAPQQTRLPRVAAASAATAGIIPLRTLTSQLERFWYARAIATADDFSVCLGSLEALGCKLD